MDADRVRSYLQVACAGLGFDIGEVWWMSNDGGAGAVAAIEGSSCGSCGNESDSSGEGTYANMMGQPKSSRSRGNGKNGNKKKTPSKRFLQLYTSKAYCNQRSKLVQPHDEESKQDSSNNDNGGSTTSMGGSPPGPPSGSPGSPGSKPSSSKELSTLRRTDSFVSLELDQEHVLSPRIVEAVTHSTQVVWANCQKTEGLLGRSDIKLQTAIGMPVGVDESGNVWVVVMFSPKNVESTTDAIDYLQYISRSAASTNIPCLLPVVGEPDPPPTQTPAENNGPGNGKGSVTGAKMLCNGGDNDSQSPSNKKQPLHHSHSLVSIKSTKQPDHTQELGDGVTAKFVSFNLNDDDDDMNMKQQQKSPGEATTTTLQHGPSENDLRLAPKDDWGIPMLPETAEMNHNPQNNNSQSSFPPDAIDNAITDAFDEASYGVWSTIMNSAGGQPTIRTSEIIATKMHLISERLEEFATAFLGMSVFDVADAWTVSSASANGEANNPVLKCLFTVAATHTNPGINAFREVSASASIQVADGAVGKAYSSGYPVWSSVKDLIYDSKRKSALESCKIETAFAVPIFSSGDCSPTCVLSCYSLLPAESVPFVLNFVQKAVRLLWSGLDRVVNPHQSIGKELWKDVGPADLGEMAADVEMQKAFIGKKRPRSDSLAVHTQAEEKSRDRSSSLATQMNVLPSLAPSPATTPYMNVPINAPPVGKGMLPAPLLPNKVQERPPNAQQFTAPQQFLFLDSGNDGHWAVQQAVQSVGDVQLWENGINGAVAGNQYNEHGVAPEQQQQQQQQQLQLQQQYIPKPPPMPMQQQQQPIQPQQPQHFQMSYVNYQTYNTNQPAPSVAAYPPQEVHTDDPATIHQNLMEINAMAQVHGHPAPATAALPPNIAINGIHHGVAVQNGVSNGIHHTSVMQHQRPHQPLTNGTANNGININRMVVIPISQAEGSVILTGPQQNMYCTTTVQPVDPRRMDNLFAVERKPCRIEGCNGFAVSKRPYCAQHCGNRQCERDGCTKCAQGATRFCIAHGGGRRCTFPGCDKGARDKYFCAAHGGGKRCKKNGCSKSAVGGSNFCTGHGGGKRCQVPGCDKSAQSSTKFCVKHGGGKKCQHQGCEKVARGRTMYCAAHGGGVRCKLEGCNRVAIGKAQLCRAHGGGASSQFCTGAI